MWSTRYFGISKGLYILLCQMASDTAAGSLARLKCQILAGWANMARPMAIGQYGGVVAVIG